MAIPTVVRDTQLMGKYLFDHTPYVRNEIDRFIERFEKNERHREFDGILRASHALIEAAETPVEALFDTGKVRTLTNDINELTAKIRKLSQPTYANEHAEYLAQVSKNQKERLDLRRLEVHENLRSYANQRD
ncbi:hypothetical protein KIN20_026668 [Parelaphostrongylus tenuis]|uniref:Biogenesis of lysosome-related organelles complex 1 subunit 5 n=1 Tax=Parelaphostrongylus tenuis TaxID=148309 RepID=A0AAD5WCZ2_PARTN|nr:hypothetical protein KIN20_026668 [Parelaphostrongylus tenuis]